MMTITQLKKDLKSLANPKKAGTHQRFFKTGKGEYGEGDIFIGLSMPNLRNICKKYTDLSIKDLEELLQSKIHEHRMSALIILNKKFEKADIKDKEKIYKIYMRNYNYINNWDLVDISAPNIPGNWLLDKDKRILYNFAKSKHLWKKRIAILSTLTFIKNNNFIDTLKISRILLHDKHDLTHKAVGWMLRELGKKDQTVEERFLKKYYKIMPRTMLRYAIERFEEDKRQKYLKGAICG